MSSSARRLVSLAARNGLLCRNARLFSVIRRVPPQVSFQRSTLPVSRPQIARYFSSYPPHKVVPMPSLSPTMESGSIGSWFLKEGDRFDAGIAICEVVTDKASVTYDATEEGYIAKILVSTGDVKVGQPLMITVEDQSQIAAFANYSVSGNVAEIKTQVKSEAKTETPVAATVTQGSTQSVKEVKEEVVAVKSSTERVAASPYAKKLARESDVPLNNISGSGPNGRIVAEDVLKAVQTAASKSVSSASSSTTAPATSSAKKVSIPPSANQEGIFQDFQLSELSLAVAARQTWAKQNVPHYYISVDLNLDKLIALRDAANKNSDVKISVLDFFVKASGLAMRKVPDLNGCWMDTFVRRYHQVDVNVIVEGEAGLRTPVVRDAAATGLRGISSALAQSEDAFGTFSIHDLGKYGVKSAAPIVLVPQSCALAIGAVQDQVIPRLNAKEGEENWQVKPMVTVTLSCDHRVVDGAVGAQWLSALKALIEDPVTMIL